MKVTIIGGGSTYTPELVEGLALWHLAGGPGQVTLLDTDPRRLSVVGGFSRRLVHSLHSHLEIQEETHLHRAVDHADFVVITIRPGGREAQVQDLELARSLGLPVQEHLGAPALTAALRAIPEVLLMARTVRDRAPGAWILNLTQPVGVLTEVISRFATAKVVGICQAPRDFHMNLAHHLRVEPGALHVEWTGLNHLAWIRGIRVDGQNRLPDLLGALGRWGGKRWGLPEYRFPPALLRRLGMLPGMDLAPYYLGPDCRGSSAAEFQDSWEWERRLLEIYEDHEKAARKPTQLRQRRGTRSSETAVLVMRALMQEEPSSHVVNTMNLDAVAGFPQDAAIEVPCLISRNGISATGMGELEDFILGLMHQVKSSERLVMEAAMNNSHRKMYLALLNHPLVGSHRLADAWCNSLKQRGYL